MEFKQELIGKLPKNEIEKSYIEAKEELGLIFDSNESGQERIAKIIAEVDPILNIVKNRELVVSSLRSCENLESKKEFIDKTFLCVKSLIDFKINNLRLFVEEVDGQDKEFIKINELLSYGFGDGCVHIHVVPEKKVPNIMIAFREGMQKLTEMIKEDESIKKVTASSWIVAKHPKILERAGFTVTGEISEEFRRRHFQGEQRPIWGAYISREELLRIYTKKE